MAEPAGSAIFLECLPAPPSPGVGHLTVVFTLDTPYHWAMTKMRVLLLGGSGQVGTALQRARLPDDWELRAPTSSECDFMQPASIGKIFHDVQPELVINAAALSHIDMCEADPARAREINFHAVAHIAGQCANADAPLVHISTDYVFDGSDGDRAYLPDDPMNPINLYGQSKMLGEEAVRHGLYWHVILRTSFVFSARGSNILTKTIKQIEAQDTVEAATDIRANPTSAEAVAEALIVVSKAILHGKGNGFGTFHLSGDSPATRFEFLRDVMAAYAPYTERRPILSPILSAALPTRIPRPASSILNNDKIMAAYGIAPRSWRSDLERSVAELVKLSDDKTVA